MQVVLIGAGELGSRHLQAMARLPEVDAVHVIEPVEAARERAKARWDEMAGHHKKLIFSTDVPQADVAIIATLAQQRLLALKSVLQAGIKHVLCEKILFPSVAQYKQALAVTAAAKAAVYVNYIYRYIPAYGYLKRVIAKEGKPLKMHIKAGNNGMGCNLIHFLDLFEWLSGAPIDQLKVTIDRPFLPCKRGKDLMEFTGKAEAKAKDHAFDIVYAGGEFVFPVVTLEYGRHTVVIDEAQDGCRSTTDGGLRQYPTRMPYVSEVSAQIVSDMVKGLTMLPAIEEAFNANRIMLNEFNHSLFLQADEAQHCPIT